MSSAVPRSIVRNGQSRRRAIAVAAVLLVLVSSIALLLPDGSSDYTDDDYYVTYHPGSAEVTDGLNDEPAGSSYNDVTIKYDGVPVAEYNPQFWSGNISGVTSDNIRDWYAIKGYQKDRTTVFTGWKLMDSQGNAKGDTIDPGEDLTSLADGNNSISLVATWATLSDIQIVSYGNRLSDAINAINDDDGKYRSIILLTGTNNTVSVSTVTKSVTIRSESASNTLTLSLWNQYWNINKETIIDNVRLSGAGGSTTQDHTGIYANCNRLILGTGIECAKSSGSYVQVAGGPYNGSGSYDSTDIRIFSGTYSNVIGGGGAEGGGSNGYSGTISSANVTILGNTTVIESVIGGSVNAPATRTNVLVAGHANISTNGYGDDGNIRGDFSTVIGGSRYGAVTESNVVVAGEARLFAVQGGGRTANSHTGTTNVTICGNSNVKIVVGSVTDGNPNSRTPVDHSNVTVRGSPTIDSVYGGGWDIWALPTYPSTGDIRILIEGNPDIVNVFGGGFRGSVGVQGSQGDTVSIRIEGGSIDAVYGGGSGGLDSVYDYNKNEFGGGREDSTGPAQVHGNVSIEITGGTIGTVYGGGQGAARSASDHREVICARVYGDVSISVSGGADVGCIYGGGKGIDSDPSVAGVTGSISISIDGSEVGPTLDGGDASGSVYGGGMYSDVLGDISISVEGSTISGSVYGGGRGLSSNNVYGSVNATNVSIELNAGTKVGGSVYGGGEYGLLESGTVSMSLIGTGTSIGGSVYGGGLGTENVLSTVVSERTIVINGPTIYGSVYGGSRNGDDNYVDEASGYYPTCKTDIYVLSGNIAAGSSGNIYGGAYKGRSKMDVGIYVGSAVPEQIGKPVARSFSIHSIFGGASVGEVTDSYDASTVLLHGNTSIAIGGQGFTGRISGDVFGAGDYCDIDGESTITFKNFEQTGSMLSIQKADRVKLHDTELILDGDVDGNSTSGSAKLSINDVGMLVLYGNCTEDGRSGLTMNAQVSALSGYESVHDGDFTSGSSYTTGVMNYLRLNGGKMFSVLGPDNDGRGMSGTSTKGATLLLRDDNTYYGALAISGPSVDSSAEFVLEDGTVAGRTTYDYSSGVEVTVWYIAGAFTVDETISIVSGTGTDSAVIGIPKMADGSTIRYVGHYTSMSSEGSLNVVENPSSDSDGTDFQVLLGTSSGGIQYDNGKGLNIASAEGSVEFDGSGASIGVTVTTDTSFNRTGYAGTIHIHMVEEYGGIVIGTFDIEIAVILTVPQPAGKEYEIEQDILVKDHGANQHHGETDVYLPVLNGGAVGTYTLVSVNGIPTYGTNTGDLVMSLASTYLNKSGWLSTSWTEKGLSDGSYNALLGDGGLFSPVLHFDFTCPGHDEPDADTKWDPITLVVRVDWTQDGKPYQQEYKIILTPKHASERTVAFYDKWLSMAGDEVSWDYLYNGGVRVPSFTLSMEFGDSIMGLYVAINLDGLSKARFDDWNDYMTRFQIFLLTDDNDNVITGSSREDSVFSDPDYTIVPVYLSGSSVIKPLDLLDYYQYYKSNIPGFSIDKDYIKNVRWFDNPDGPAQFNFYSQVTDDGLSLYAGYGVIITFKPEVEGDSIGDEKPWVSPSTMFLEDMSREVTFNNLKDSIRVTEGYAIKAFLNEKDQDIGGTSMHILNDITVTVVLVAETYELSVKVFDENGKDITEDVDLTFDESLHFGEDASVTISYTDTGQQYRILRAEGKYGSFTLSDFTFTQAGDNNYSVCEFSMPSGDLELTITLAKRYTLTVRLPVSSPSTDDNRLFGFGQGGDGITIAESGQKTVVLDIGLNGNWSIDLALPGGYEGRDVTVTVGSSEGATATISGGKLELTEITGDVVIDLKVNIEWRLTVNGEGYNVIRDNDSLGAGSTVHTGDVLILMTHAGYEFDSRPTVSGGRITSNSPYTIAVDGTGDVTISGNATPHQIVLTVHVVFGGDHITVLPSGSLTADGSVVDLTLQGNTATGTVTVDSGGEVVLKLSFDGYIELTETVYPSAGEVTLHAVPELRDETDPVKGPTGDFVLVVSAGDADGEHTVAGLSGSGTFSIRDGMSVTLGEGKVTLSGFSDAVGTVVVEIGETAPLTVVVVPQPVGHVGPVIL